MQTTEIASLSDYEIERGKPMPSKNHGLLQGNLTGLLFAAYRQQYSILTEVTLELGEKIFTPDICIYPKMAFNALQDEVRLKQAPLTAIEILSPTQGTEHFEGKFAHYFAHGIGSVWFVEPMIRTIAIFLPEQAMQVFHDTVLKDPYTQIEIDLREVFV
ncbi:MAG: hypothetical protein OHK0053_34840 [Microscillaceae bacterium]